MKYNIRDSHGRFVKVFDTSNKERIKRLTIKVSILENIVAHQDEWITYLNTRVTALENSDTTRAEECFKKILKEYKRMEILRRIYKK